MLFYILFYNKVRIYSACNLFQSQLRQCNVHEIPSVRLASSYFTISNSVANNNMKSISKESSLCPPVPPKYLRDEILGSSREQFRVLFILKKSSILNFENPLLEGAFCDLWCS